MGVFCYSDEETSQSFALDCKVDEETIAERRDQLMAIQRRISQKKLRRFLGQRVEALVEGPSQETELVWEARLEGMAPEIDGKVYVNDIQVEDGGVARPGDVVTVEIIDTHEYDLVGRVVAIADRQVETMAATAGLERRPTTTVLRVLA